MAQLSEEPPFLTVGTDVSAKYRGAFCEANVKVVKKLVKCKVTFTKTNSSVTINDDCVKGSLKVGAVVEAKNPDGQFMEGVITKLTDASVYTVVFDDGDERTLRRTSLCLKGGRHFNESETLDHLPLTDPENFGTPVVQDGKKRKKRRLSQAASMDDSETERDEQRSAPTKKKCLFDDSIVGKVVIVESGSKRRNMWFPALGVNPSKNEVDLMKSKEKCLVRSFKDGKYHVINVKDAKDFSKDQDPVHGVLKGENRKLKAAVGRALTYLDTGRIPGIWEENSSDVIVHGDSEEDFKKPHSSEDEGSVEEDEEKKAFKEKLFAFMEEKGTPITRPPVLGNQDLDLHKLYRIVQDHGGMEKVSNESLLWRKIYQQMDIPVVPPSASHHIKMAYKKYLYPFEVYEKEGLKPLAKDKVGEQSITNDKNLKPESPDSAQDSSDEKHLECLEPLPDIDDDEIILKKAECKQSTRIREMKRQQSLDNGISESQAKSPEEDVSVDVVNSPESSSDVSEPHSDGKSDVPVDELNLEIGDKVQVKYGRGRNHRLYDAKIIHIDPESSEGAIYCIHYAGWNNRYDEWIKPEKIAGWGTRQTRNRTGSTSKGQESNSKSTPKPMTRPTTKPASRRTSKAAVAPAKEMVAKPSSASNGSKCALKRPCSPSTRSGSVSPSLGKSPKTGPGRGTGRTRSERNSLSDVPNGLDEVKSPLSRRRQKSTTPEPSLTEQQNKSTDVVNHVQPIPEVISGGTENITTEEMKSLVCSSESADISKNLTSYCENGVSSEISNVEQGSVHSSGDVTGKRKDKSKRTVNGLIKSVASPEGVSKDFKDTSETCPEPKKVKVENENSMQDRDVKDLLSDNTAVKIGNQPLQTLGTATTMETVSAPSSEDTKLDIVSDSAASSSAQCSDDSEKTNEPVENSPRRDTTENTCEHNSTEKDSKLEKKNSEHHHRKHKKRKEKKKHRHTSGNDSTGSDAPGSPVYSQSQRVFSSPRRPRMSFDMDLEEIKAKEDGGERIRLLQDKINEMRKMYSSLKAEVASIDRKRRRLKKKREAAETEEVHEAHKSIASSSSSSHAIPSPSIPPVECR